MTDTILITGTSSGYGKAIAEHFLNEGWHVIATMRRPEAAAFEGETNRLRVLSAVSTNGTELRL
ncbi:MAG: SDR family NAD(P)-dependent oxidoreductase [Sphingopyxis sp.]|nr:SDR family NAD(P)-dependent oxidoreductase [Sphingopyxis sp.]